MAANPHSFQGAETTGDSQDFSYLVCLSSSRVALRAEWNCKDVLVLLTGEEMEAGTCPWVFSGQYETVTQNPVLQSSIPVLSSHQTRNCFSQMD